MARGRRPHNRNSRKHTEYRTRAAGFDERGAIRKELQDVLPDAPEALIGEVARAATLSQAQAKQILATRAQSLETVDADDVQRATKVLDDYDTHSA